METSSSSYSSSSQSNGILEIDLDRLPPYKRIPTSSPAPSIGSSPLSNRNHSRNISTRPTVSRLSSNIEYTRFGKFIGNIRKILNDNEWDFSDAEIIVDGVAVGVNRLVLASMSSFFHELFRKQKSPCANRPRLYISDLIPHGKVGREPFLLVLGYLYTGDLKSYPEQVSKCVDDNCSHDTCHPAIDFQLQLLYASATFQIDELVSLLQTNLFNVVEKALVEDIIPILMVAFHCNLSLLQDHCIKKVARSDIHNLWIDRILPYELQLKVRLFRVESVKGTHATAELEFPDESRVKRIYQAMDTNDVDTLYHLLSESPTTLDETYGLHYAVAYCEPKVVSNILELGAANVNLRNPRGFTVLHMAARRTHPAILESLLLHGASASDLTFDGQSPASICRRMIKLRDYAAIEHTSVATNDYRLCIEILERGVLGSTSSVNLLSPTTYPLLDTQSAMVWNFFCTSSNMVEDENFAPAVIERSKGVASKHHGVAYFNEPLAKLRKHFTTVMTLVRITRMMRPQRRYRLGSDGPLQALSLNPKFEGGNICRASVGESRKQRMRRQRTGAWNQEYQHAHVIQPQTSFMSMYTQHREGLHIEQRQKSLEVATFGSFPTDNLKKLLIACAQALAENNMNGFDRLVEETRGFVCISGEPIQRLGAYMIEGLIARKVSSGTNIYHALRCNEPESKDLLSYMHILYEICPCMKFGYMAANQAIAEACRTENRIHIIDFKIGQGTQWVTLLQALAAKPGGAPYVRITGIDDPVSRYARGDGFNPVGRRLAAISEKFNIPVVFHGLPVFTPDVTSEMLDVRPGEALAVNLPMQLHRTPDESVDVENPRDKILRMVKSLNPKVTTLVEQESNTNTAHFLPRFVETLSYYLAIFESIDETLQRDRKERIGVERHCLARDIVNVIACEKEERVVRHELFGKWKSRFMMAGFRHYPFSSNVSSVIGNTLRCYSEAYTVEEKDGAMLLGWKDRKLISASAWQ